MGKQNLKEECVKELARAMYFQRPLKSQKQNIGKCVFEKGKYRCIDSHPDYEEFRMLSFINNIKIQTPRDLDLRALNGEERAKILPLFYRKSKTIFDFEDIKFTLERNGDVKIVTEGSSKVVDGITMIDEFKTSETNTGDSANIFVAMLMMFLSLMLMVLFYFKKIKYNIIQSECVKMQIAICDESNEGKGILEEFLKKYFAEKWAH